MQEMQEMGVQSPGPGKSSEGHGYLCQYSCLGNPMDRGAWQATVHRVAKGQTCLKWLSKHHIFWYLFYSIFSLLSSESLLICFIYSPPQLRIFFPDPLSNCLILFLAMYDWLLVHWISLWLIRRWKPLSYLNWW